MVYLDWSKILSIDFDNFSETEKDGLLETVTWYSPTSDIDRNHLTALVKVIQEILKYKTEQVESLMGALEELASKQGEEVARGRQDLLEDIEELQEQLAYERRMTRQSGFSDEQMRTELERMEVQNDELVAELQEREKELMAEKSEVERLSDQVIRLERERAELLRELETSREDVSDHRRDSGSIQASSEKVEELIELTRQKNRHIIQLLDDIEALEVDNNNLRAKLTTVRGELAEANSNITDKADKILQLNVSVDDLETKCKEKDVEIKALTAQIEELVKKKAKHERDLDDFALKLDERVNEWKQLLDSKDKEISQLREELSKTCFTSVANFSQDFTEDTLFSPRQVTELSQRINLLLDEKTEQIATICQLRQELEKAKNNESNEKIIFLENKLKKTEERLRVVENEAEDKSKEISDVVSQLRAYERNEFGLTDAVEKIRKLEKKLQERNFRIEELVAACNKLKLDMAAIEDENLALKEKLGLSPSHVLPTSFNKENLPTVATLQKTIAELSDELVELRLKNRVKALPTENDDLEKKYFHAIEENDSLRKGLHEILDSIKSQTMGKIEATAIERLLEAFDARHLSGWYHPAMRLQAQLNKAVGEANELRSRICFLEQEKVSLTHQLKDNLSLRGSEDEQQVQDATVQRVNPPLEEEEQAQLYLQWEEKEAELKSELLEVMKERDMLKVKLGELNLDSGIELPENGETREGFIENELKIVQGRYFRTKESLLRKNIALKKEKSLLKLKVEKLEKLLEEYTPPERLAELENQLRELAERLNIALCREAAEMESADKLMKLHGLIERMSSNQETIQHLFSRLNELAENTVTTDKTDQTLIIRVLGDLQKLRECLNRNVEEFRQVYEDYKKGENFARELEELSTFNAKLKKNIVELETKMVKDAKFSASTDLQMREKRQTLCIERKARDSYLEMYKTLFHHLQSCFQLETNGEIQEDYDTGEEINDEDELELNDSLEEILIRNLNLIHQYCAQMNDIWGKALCFPSLDKAFKIIASLKDQMNDLQTKAKDLEVKENELHSKSDELSIQLSSLDEFKIALKSGAVLVDWHNRATEQKLTEAKYKRLCHYLEGKVEMLEKQLADYKEEIIAFEQELLEKERKCRGNEKLWVEAQAELLKHLKDHGYAPMTSLPNTSNQQLIEELQKLREENTRLTEELKNNEEDSTASPVETNIPTKEVEHDCNLHGAVKSLEEILKQKEERILHYQNLLAKAKEEYSGTITRLQDELRNVHAALVQQSKAYSRMKHGIYQPATADVENSVRRIQELEEELTNAQSTAKRAASELAVCRREADRWRKAAMESDNLLDELRERTDAEAERLREEISNNLKEIEKLREMASKEKSLIAKISDLEGQLRNRETYRRPVKHLKDEEGTLERQLKASREECSRLRQQIEAITRSREKKPARNDLVDKIKKLEESLQLSKKHEQEVEEMEMKKIQSVQEVTRWDERKRYQKSLEKLKISLREKEVEANAANKKAETLRNLMTKLEKERNQLELQIRHLTETVRRRQSFEILLDEKAHLEAQVTSLEEEINKLNRREETASSAMEGERIDSEMFRLQERNSDLEKENLALKVKIEKLRIEIRRDESLKTNRFSSARAYNNPRELDKERQKLQVYAGRINLLTSRNTELEQQVHQLKTQLDLWENKDMMYTAERNSLQETVSQLKQELIEVKAELTHKSHLLGRVKILLCRAAAKEKSLNEKVSAFQKASLSHQ